LSRLPEVLRHWRLTGPDAVLKTTIQDAVAKYLEYRATQDISRKTFKDSKSALRSFTLINAGRYVHEITGTELHEYLNTKTAGSSRRATYKQLKLFFDWAKRERVVAVYPMENIKAPVVKPQEAVLYTPDEFERLLRTADVTDRELVPFLALSGFGMMRTGELVRPYADKPVLRWENVIWERGLVDVPEAVAKQTRRAVGNRREFPLCDALTHWLESFKGRTGRIVEPTQSSFRRRLHAVGATAGVKILDNGLRKSAISHFIAANPTTGVVLTARYAGNSEAISRRHYVAWCSEERGLAWFSIRGS
jgi:integrase